MYAEAILVAVLSLLAHRASAQIQIYPAAVHSTSFNSSFKLSKDQIDAAQLDASMAESLQNTVNFDRTQLAFGGPAHDDFYTLPPLSDQSGPLKPGQILKIQPFTDPTAYAIPPYTALSRILYTTTNFNGTIIPASGFILWPFKPRKLPTLPRSSRSTRAPVVIWNHGTSGFFASAAPSAHRGLWYEHAAPFTLALAGYAVFAPDYAGLGIAKSWNGSDIPHQYHASLATARDALYGLRAARVAFPDKLDERFVAFGHSQGGGVAWAVAEVLAEHAEEFADLVGDYKGSVAGSPTTDVFSSPIKFVLPTVGLGLSSIFPEFKLEEWLTPLGMERLKLVREVEGANSVVMQLMMTRNDTVRDGALAATWYADVFSRLCEAGRREFKGPLLVLSGTEDIYVPHAVTSKTVKETWALFPQGDLELHVAEGVGHVPLLYATRQYWLRWIEDRLSDKPLAKKGKVQTEAERFLPIEQYQKSGQSFSLWAGLPQYSYEVPLAD